MRELLFFLEEFSAAAMLEGLLPKIIPANVTTRFITFEGKQDLEKQLIKRLRGYRNPNALFVVVRDQDAQPDCKVVKRRVARLCRNAGRSSVLVRIACRELEAFYLGDLVAVERGLGCSGIARQQQTRRFRAPDQVVSPKKELRSLTGRRYQPVAGSRAIGEHLDPENDRSHSFHNLVLGIRRLMAAS